MRLNYAQISQNIIVRKQAREEVEQHVSVHPDSHISTDSQSRNEIRTNIKKFKGLGQGRNLIKMEIRPRDVQLCFCGSCTERWAQPCQVITLQTDKLYYPGMIDFVFLFTNSTDKQILKKEQPTSVTVANSNHLSHTTSFSYHKYFGPLHYTSLRLQYWRVVLLVCIFNSFPQAPGNAFCVLSLVSALQFCSFHLPLI